MISQQRQDEILKRLQEMKAVYDSRGEWMTDPVSDHVEADALLLELIDNPQIAEAFNAIKKWYE